MTRLLHPPAWVRVLITAVVAVYLARRIDLAEASRGVSQLGALVWAQIAVVLLVDRLVMWYRWALLLRAVGAALAPWRSLHIFLTTSFVGSFLPAGIGADAARAAVARAHGEDGGKAVVSVVADRWLGVVGLALVSLASVRLGGAVPDGLAAWNLGFAAVVGLASLAALFSDAALDRLAPFFGRHPYVGRALTRLARAVGDSRRAPRLLLAVLALSVVVQLVRVWLALTLGRGLGLPLGWPEYLAVMPLAILITLVPVSLGGFGVPQAAMVWLLAPLGVSATDAVVLSALFVAAGVVANLPGGLLFALDGASRPAPRPRS